MDGTLVLVALDISGRGGLTWNAAFPTPRCGEFDTELVREFWAAFSREARLTLHIHALSVDNSHHLSEAVFKGVGRALKAALAPACGGASTKGLWI
jgi:imidazoleglycerol-phosphate dehydratase